MTRRQKDPLRVLSADERTYLEQLSRAHSAPAAQVSRARMLLAVANGTSYLEADCYRYLFYVIGMRRNSFK